MGDPFIEAIGRCNPEEPLQPGDARWCNFDQVRGIALHRRIVRRLTGAESAGKCSHIALAGHRGCGKSTELARVQDYARESGYLPLYAVVNEQADPNEVGFGDLVLLMLRMLDDAFHDPVLGLKPLPEKTVQVVREWFQEVTHIQEQEIERSLQYAGQAGLGIETPLARLLFGLSALRKTTGKQRDEVRQAVERYPEQLRQNINLLLDDALRLCRERFPRGILFVLDNLDRYPPDMISDTVLRHSELFNGIMAHTIFVVPISLLYEPVGETVADRYEAETLPMIPVFRRDDPQRPASGGMETLVQAIYRRVPAELFAGPDLAREVARLSGGCPRDLLRLLKEALLESEGQVDARAVQRAANIVRGEMARKLTLAHYRVLASAQLDTAIDSDETGRFLLYRRAALEYNGERWIGVHPLLWEAREFKHALAAEQARRAGRVAAGEAQA